MIRMFKVSFNTSIQCFVLSNIVKKIPVTFYDQMLVLQAFGLTFGVVAGLTAYTLQSKRDLTAWGSG